MIEEMKVCRIEEHTLSDEEKDTVDRIGIENLDYCVAAIVQNRYPDENLTYLEEKNAFEVDGNRFELEFEITADEPDYLTVSRHIQTLELLFEI